MRLAKGAQNWLIAPIVLLFCSLLLSIITTDAIQAISRMVLVFSVLLLGFFLMFFRDPDRNIISKGVAVVADGKIRAIEYFSDEKQKPYVTISTFMNVHNVHVNRMPLDGVIQSVEHHKGAHLPAFKKESEKNERVVIVIQTPYGRITVIQIAGTLARRIVPYIKPGETVEKGQRIGLIRLGSRVDISLPTAAIAKICVQKGDRVQAGVDCIAELHD